MNRKENAGFTPLWLLITDLVISFSAAFAALYLWGLLTAAMVLFVLTWAFHHLTYPQSRKGGN